MQKELRCNVILTAQLFNPSILSQLWLFEKGIVGRNDFGEGSAFSHEISQSQTKDFHLLVIPNQLQFTPATPQSEWAELARTKITQIVDSLPETPFVAIGINFDSIIAPKKMRSKELERKLFLSEKLPFAAEFKAPDCHFGGYMSKDQFGGRLKLEIRPVVVLEDGGVPSDRLLLKFNFHRDVDSANRVGTIKTHIGRFEEALGQADRIVDELLNFNG